MRDKIMEDRINELLQQNEENLKTFFEKRKELESLLSQLKENINKNFENVVIELKKMLQKIPYCHDTVAEEQIDEDGYKLYMLSYRDTEEDNFIKIKKGKECLITIYKYRDCIFTNTDEDKSLYGKVFLLQNLEEVKSMLLRLFYSVVKRNEEIRKYKIEKLETEIRVLEGVVRKDAEGTEEKQR